MSHLRRAIFLDRDGVLNESIVREGRPYPPANVSEVIIPVDVPAALLRLRALGFLLIVCTNQPDVGRGTQTAEGVEQIHALLRSRLALDHIEVCFDAADGGTRRKPEPGMILDACAKFGIEPLRSYMVGDRWRDVEAGRRAGCFTIHIDLGYNEGWPVPQPDLRVRSMSEVQEAIVARMR